MTEATTFAARKVVAAMHDRASNICNCNSQQWIALHLTLKASKINNAPSINWKKNFS
jgi:hypothetical protein